MQNALIILNSLARIFWLLAGFSTLLVISLILVFITSCSIWGLPYGFQNLLRSEFSERGLSVSWKHIRLDFQGRVVLEHFRCHDLLPGQRSVIVIPKVLLELEWLSFVKKKQILKGLTIDQASIKFLFQGDEEISIDGLNGRAIMSCDRVVIEDLVGSYGRTKFFLRGEILPAVFARSSISSSAVSTSEFRQHEPIMKSSLLPEPYLRKLLKTLKNCPTQIRVRVSPRSGFSWNAIAAEITVDVCETELEGVRWESLSLHAVWENNSLSLRKFLIKTPKGNLSLLGHWDSIQGIIHAVIYATAAPESLSPILPETLSKRFKNATTHGSFILESSIRLHLKKPSESSVHGRLEWMSVTLGEGCVDQITVPFHFSENSLLIPTAKIESAEESLQIRVSSVSADATLMAEIVGKLNPAKVKFLLPEAEEFFASTVFQDPVDVNLHCLVSMKENNKLNLQGSFSAGNVVYKGVDIKSVTGQLEYSPPVVKLKGLLLSRPEGSCTAEYVEYNYVEPSVLLKNVESRVMTLPTARIFSSKLEEYLLPYAFPSPPQIKLNGKIDLSTGQNTDLSISFRGKETRYKLFGRELVGENFSAELTLISNELQIDSFVASLDDGKLQLRGKFDLSSEKTPYQLRIELNEANFARLAERFFQLKDVSGICTGSVQLSGRLDDLRTIRGKGQIEIRNGSLIDIPFLGALSRVTGLIELGKARANEATANFSIEKGRIFTDNLTIRSLTMGLFGKGHYDFIQDELHLDVRINLRSPVSMLLHPFSKLFEYRGTGSLAKPLWEPKIFSAFPAVPSFPQGTPPSVRGRNL